MPISMNAWKKYILITFVLILSLCLWYMSWFWAIFQLYFWLLFYTCIAYMLSCLWKRMRWKTRTPIWDFFLYFLPKILSGLALILLLILVFCFYQNVISPAQMPLHTISNGKKTLKFQTMSHVASESFYAWVAEQIQISKEQNFVLFFEGVGAGSTESSEIFNQVLWINFEAGLYENFSKLYGVVAQNNDDFLNIINNKDYNVDLNLDEVIKIYQEKQKDIDKETSETHNISDEVLDINSEIITMLSELNSRELAVVRYLNQAVMNFIIKNEWLRNTIVNELGNTDIFSVILDDRNEYLVQEILNSDEDKIHILYWLMHFSWVLEILKTRDTRWQIIETQYSQVIEPFGS